MRTAAPGLAFAAAFRRFITRRVGLAIIAGAVLGSFLGGLLTGWGVMGGSLAAAVGLMITLAVSVGVAHLLLGSPGRAMVEAVLWLTPHAQEHWRERTDGTSIPRSDRQARAWLAANPATGANRSQRVQAWLMAGDADAARAELGALPADSADERVGALFDEWLIRVWTGGTAPGEEGEQAARELRDDALRAHALRDLLLLRAMEAAHRGGAWQDICLELRQRIGSAADGVLWRRFWPVVAAIASACYVIGALVALLAGWW